MANYCANCGMLLDAAGETCSNCGYTQERIALQPNQAGQVYQHPTPYQQVNVYPQAPAYSLPKSRVAYVLLGLFLGNLGIHNFYAGYSSKAVTQLLLTVFLCWTIVVPIGVAIWVIVEICTITQDFNGVQFN